MEAFVANSSNSDNLKSYLIRCEMQSAYYRVQGLASFDGSEESPLQTKQLRSRRSCRKTEQNAQRFAQVLVRGIALNPQQTTLNRIMPGRRRGRREAAE